MQGIIPCFTLPIILFMPESPSWLSSRGKGDEALAILANLHANGEVNDPLVLKEMAEINEVLHQAAEGITWRALATNKKNRMRVFIVTIMTLMALWCGQNVITYYFTSILTSIGITATTQQYVRLIDF